MSWRVLIFLLVWSYASGQDQVQPTYTMVASLDSATHSLQMNVTVSIPRDMAGSQDSVWFHLSANAYSNTQNRFTEQSLKMGDASFYFSKEKELSTISSLVVTSQGKDLNYVFKDETNEWLGMETPAADGDFREVTFSYLLKLPKYYHGFGYKDGDYYLTIFYPTLVVNKDGHWQFFHSTPCSRPKNYPSNIHVDISTQKNFGLIANGNSKNADGVGGYTIDATGTERLEILLFDDQKQTIAGTLKGIKKQIPYKVVFVKETSEKEEQFFKKTLESNFITILDSLGDPSFDNLSFVVHDQNMFSCNQEIIHITHSKRVKNMYAQINNSLFKTWNGTGRSPKRDSSTKSSFDEKKMYFAPLPAYTDNDKFILGFTLGNSLSNNTLGWTYNVTPLYSFKNKKLLGLGRTSYRHLLKGDRFSKIEYSIGIKSFDMNANKVLDYTQRYVRVDPSVTLWFNHDGNQGVYSFIKARAFIIDEQYPLFEDMGVYVGLNHQRSNIFKLMYQRSKESTLSGTSFNTTLEQQSYKSLDTPNNYIKLSQTITQRYMYANKKNIYFRLFGAGFLTNTNRESSSYQNIFSRGSIALIHQSFNDYTYEEFYFARQNQSGFQDNQTSMEFGGGFKTPVGSSNSIGMSNHWAASISTSADIPFRLPAWLPIRVYFDIGTYSTFQNDTYQNNVMYNGGLSYNFKDVISLNVPLVYSTDLGNAFKGQHDSFFSRISFGINIQEFERLQIRRSRAAK